jgi:hypothetical protein
MQRSKHGARQGDEKPFAFTATARLATAKADQTSDDQWLSRVRRAEQIRVP